MSVTFTLSGSYMQVNASLYPAWDYKLRRMMNRDDHRMLDASLFSYKWSASDRMTFSIEGVTYADALQINRWWQNSQSLIFTINRDGYDPGIPVRIVNETSPLNRFLPPRVDYYKGKLELESLYPAGLMMFLLVDHNQDYITTGSGENIGVLSR